jgi:hypothetical protein
MRLRWAHLEGMKTVILAVLAVSSAASADPFHADFELDPTAYALSGNSIHVGLGTGRYRLDLGNFALAVPRWVTGNDAYDVSFDGYGAKLQMFPLAEQRGLFVGVDAAYARVLAERRGTEMAVRDGEVQVGVDAGYRMPIAHGFYASAWLGVSRAFGASDVTLAGATYHPMRIVVFPAIHLGYSFR